MNPLIIIGGVGWIFVAVVGWLLMQTKEELGQEKQACETRIALGAAEASEAARETAQAAYEQMQADLEAALLRASARAVAAENQVSELEARGVETRTIIREIYDNEPEASDWADTLIPESIRLQLAALGGE